MSGLAFDLVDRPGVTLAYLRRLGPYGPEIAGFWTREVDPWLAARGWMHRPHYGVIHDDPMVTAPERCRYDVGVVLDRPELVPAGLPTERIAGGRYAVCPFRGTALEVGAAWRTLLMQAIPGRGLKAGPRPFLESYPRPADVQAETGTFSCELLVPLVAV